MIVFLENERNRILFRITGTESEVEECLDGCAGAAACECTVNITTIQNTTITITGDNVFGNGIITDFFIDVPCNCEAADSSLSILISEEPLQILITGEFVEGTIVTGCEGEEASIQGSVTLGDDFYNVSIQANRDGTVTAIFNGASVFTISLTGANVLISDCINSF